MDYNTSMNFAEISGKSILLLGKTRSLNHEEFLTLLKLHDIRLQSSFDESVELVVEGKMMNPMEQDESARLYQEENIASIEINELEKWLCGSIEPNRLLMSLKLSRNQERLLNFIQNPYITDELFFKLLKLYEWGGEGLFDNDSNRDVTAAIIGRFYLDIERNHNVQYAMSGLAHLIEKYGTSELIDAISGLSPIDKEINASYDRSLSSVLDAMALHQDTSEELLKRILSSRAELIAHREPLGLEDELLALDSETINTILASNPSLSSEGADRLEGRYPELIARYGSLDEVRFERLMGLYSEHLATNPHLSVSMQERLMSMGDDTVFQALASNPTLEKDYLQMLFEIGRFGVALAENVSLGKEMLERLYATSNPDVLKALASNLSTPVEILYQLSLDQRFERAVKTNSTFGHHIQTHSIGWN